MTVNLITFEHCILKLKGTPHISHIIWNIQFVVTGIEKEINDA